jgi:hypothetical protein
MFLTNLIVCSSSTHRSKTLVGPHIYSTVVRAVIESSLITWMGLLACAITSTDFLVHVQIPDATLVPLTDLGGGVSGLCTIRRFFLQFTNSNGRLKLLTHTPSCFSRSSL